MPASARMTSNRPGNFASRSLIRYRAGSRRPPGPSQGSWRPGLSRALSVGGGAEDPDSSAGVLDHREHVQPRPGQGDRVRRSHRPAGPRPGSAGNRPTWWNWLGAGSIRRRAGSPEMVEAATFTPSTSNSPCTRRSPPGILADQPQHQDANRAYGAPAGAGPAPLGAASTGSRCQRSTVSGRTTKCSPLSTSLGSRCSSAASDARSPGVNRTLSGPLPLQDRELVTQREDLRVLVPVAHRQQPQQREHVRHTEIGQSQQHGRSP